MYVERLLRIAKKWREVWEKNRVYEADPEPGKPKFFLTAAFMYPNGAAHVGHARTYVIPDILARYKRANGYNVLFPMGFHYTGTPILTTAERIASGDKEFIQSLSNSYNVPVSELSKMTDPLNLARYFHTISKEAMKDYGLSIDWRREFTTIDPEFKAFIRWQFLKLREKGLLVKGSHPVGWCPRHSMPVGMHDTKDDVEPEIDELTLIKFVGENGEFYPAATLRPETVLGVTNVWVNPDVNYCITEVHDGSKVEKWVISCFAAWKLSFQKTVNVIGRIKGSDIIGKTLINPLTGEKVPVIQATFVSPAFGTGVVMSVPAHAPYDYAALRDYIKEKDPEKWGSLRPIVLIRIEGYGPYPAKDAVERLGVKSQNDVELLDKATKEVYKAEHDKGVMIEGLSARVKEKVIEGAKDFIKKYVEGKEVKEAREHIKEFLRKHGYGSIMYEIMNAPVYCRCGTEIVVKVVHDQWFIDYGNQEWKKKAVEALNNMRIVPEEARNQFLATIDWLREKACVRSRGLGTELPWAKGWVIESLSDSTIYMAFYTVIYKIRKYGINGDKLTPEFWDYVMLGVGDPEKLSEKLGIDVNVLKDLRQEFDYWYPLDSRHSGKDLIPNHLTFFIFNHAAIFPKEKWPKQIVANGWVLIKGEKMSKSKGNVKTLHGLVNTFSPDAVRLAIATEAEVEADLSLDVDKMGKIYDRLRKIESIVNNLYRNDGLREAIGLPEKWLLTRIARHLLLASQELDNVRIRSAGIRIFYLIPQDIEEYLDMVEEPSRIVRDVIELWIKAMSVYTPFFAEELWHSIGKDTLVVQEKWPSKAELECMIDEEAELQVEYVKRVIEDLRNITKVVKGNKAIIYVSPKEEQAHLVQIVKIVQGGGKIGDVIRYVAKNFVVSSKKQIPKIGKAILDLVISLDPHVAESLEKIGGIDEKEAIMNLKGYITKKSGVEISEVYVSTDEGAPDYGGRKAQALPWRPSIYILNNQ